MLLCKSVDHFVAHLAQPRHHDFHIQCPFCLKSPKLIAVFPKLDAFLADIAMRAHQVAMAPCNIAVPHPDAQIGAEGKARAGDHASQVRS